MKFLICAISYYLYSVSGWGTYQKMRYVDKTNCCITSKGVYNYKPKNEVAWIDRILRFIYPVINSDNELDAYCLLGMSLRGLHIAPLFIALAWYYQNPFIVCLSFGMMLQGLIYYVFNSLLLPTCVKHNIDCNACAEYATGGLIGVLIVIMRSMI